MAAKSATGSSAPPKKPAVAAAPPSTSSSVSAAPVSVTLSPSQQLATACRDGTVSDVSSLLSHAAVNVNTADSDGYTFLYTGAMRGHVDVCKALLRGGAVVDVKGDDQETPLYIAVRNHHIPCVELLLTSAAKINETNGMTKETALHCAARMGYADIVDVLLKNNANVNLRTVRLETPLFMACQYGRLDCVYRLLMVDANRAMTNDDGKDPLFIASENDHKSVVKLLKVEKKYLKDMKSEVDAEERNRPPSMAELGRALAQKAANVQAEEEGEQATLASPPAKVPSPAAKRTAAPAAAASKSQQRGQVISTTHIGGAASSGHPTPTKTGFVDITPFVPISIPKGPDFGTTGGRTVDPLTGKALPPCRTMLEAGHFERPPIPAGVVKPIRAPRPMGTTIIGPDGRPVPIPSMSGDD